MLRVLPLLLLLIVLVWAIALGVTYEPGQFTVGTNYISRSGVVSGDAGGLWLIGEGARNGSGREISTGFEMTFQTTRGKIILFSIPLLLVAQILAFVLSKKRA